MKSISKFTLSVVALASLSVPAKAQFAVVDAGNIVQTIKVFKQVTEQVAEMRAMAAVIQNLPQQYRSLIVAQWQSFNPLSSCPSCGAMGQASNLGIPFQDQTLGGAVSKVQDYSKLVSSLSPEGQQSFLARISGLYLRQAALNNGITAVGAARQSDQQMVQYVAQCQSDAVSSSYVSAVQVGQSSAACQAVAVQQQSTQNRLLGALLDHQNIAAAQAMQNAADEANTQITQQQLAGASDVYAKSSVTYQPLTF